MKINLHIPKHKQFRPFYMFFIIVAMQAGVSVIGAPRILFLEAGHDSWITIIVAYCYILLLILIVIYMLRQYENTDIIGIQTDLFGSFISKVIGTAFIIYFATQLLATIATYNEIVNVFIFSDSNPFIVGLMLLIPALYAVLGGIRTTIGVVFVFMHFTFWILFLLIDPIRQMDFLNFLPIMDREITDILKSVPATAYTFSGFEVLFFIYPFIRNKEKVKKPVILGLSFFTFLVLLLTMISIGFFNPNQLERRIWPVLNLYKIQSTPIIERLDYIIVSQWMMVVIPKAILLLWCITYIAKRIYNISLKVSAYTAAGIVIILIPFFIEHYVLQQLIETTKYLTYGMVYIYPLLLLPLVMIKTSLRKKQGGKIHENK